MKLTKAERLFRQAQREEEAARRVATPPVVENPVEKQIAATEKKIKTIKTKIEKEAKPVRPVIVLPPVPIIEWHGAYDQSWKGFITDESFAHPAKASRALLGKIFDHLFSIGALSRAGKVIDPFGGIGTTGIIGAWRGCEVTCCELEPKFFKLAQDNFAMHAENLEHMGFPRPRIVNGDSRKLRQHISRTDAVISSPPYAEDGLGHSRAHHQSNDAGRVDQIANANKLSKSDLAGRDYGNSVGQLGTMIGGTVEAVVSSPPYAEGLGHGGTPTVGGGKAGDRVLDAMQDGYGDTVGQLTGMTEGDVDAVVSSPPFLEVTASQYDFLTTGEQGKRNPSRSNQADYGSSDGQLGGMKAGEVDAVVSSPPYAEIATGAGGLNTKPANHGQQGGRSPSAASQDTDQRYGESEGQLSRLPSSDVDVVISSPPYEAAISERGGRQGETEPRRDANGNLFPQESDLKPYGESPGQLGAMQTEGVDALISSPPYTPDALGHSRGEAAATETQPDTLYGKTDGQLGSLPADSVDAVVSSPPYSASGLGSSPASEGPNGRPNDNKGVSQPLQQYGETVGQLNHIPEGDVDAVISSPPFGSGDSASAQSMTTRNDKSAEWVKANVGSAGTMGYGEADGQMAEMKMQDVDAVIAGPPYENSLPQDHRVREELKEGMAKKYNRVYTENSLRTTEYGDTEGNTGRMTGETFWTAARDIVKECYDALKPGGHAAWIVKAFVRDKQIVDFPGDWRKLCEYVGFETLTEVRAMLVKRHEYNDLFGEDTVETKERKSFFRRLAEKKGSPRIDYEVIWIMKKPNVATSKDQQ